MLNRLQPYRTRSLIHVQTSDAQPGCAWQVHGRSGVPPGHSSGNPDAHVHAERIRYDIMPPMEDDIVSKAHERDDSSAMVSLRLCVLNEYKGGFASSPAEVKR